ncbi:MAG: hypothetical protein ACRDT8_07275 [Micromonosporaceae bacterium]
MTHVAPNQPPAENAAVRPLRIDVPQEGLDELWQRWPNKTRSPDKAAGLPVHRAAAARRLTHKYGGSVPMCIAQRGRCGDEPLEVDADHGEVGL